MVGRATERLIFLAVLVVQWLVAGSYFRIAFNRTVTPLVWAGSSQSVLLFPADFVVAHAEPRHILNTLAEAGFEDLVQYADKRDIEVFSIKPTTKNEQSGKCIFMADGRGFPDPTAGSIEEIISNVEAGQHEWPIRYWEITPYINMMYSLQHGYQFYRFTLPQDLPRDPAWLKVPLTAYLLQHECTHAFWVDSDAFVRDGTVSLESLGIAYDIREGGPYMLLPQDGPGHFDANSGAYLIRNGTQIHDFLREWYALPMKDEAFRPKLRERLYEQDVLNNGMRKYKGKIWVLAPKKLMTTTGGTFVRHFWAEHHDKPDIFERELARMAMEFVQYLIRSHSV